MIHSGRAYRLLLSLFAIQLRGNLVPIALSGVALPVSALAAFPVLRTASAAVLLPLLAVTLLVVPPTFARLRSQGQFSYFAGLAIDRFPLLLAFLTIYALVTVLGVCLTTLAAVAAVHMRFTLSGWSLVIVGTLTYLALAGVGMLLGTIVPRQIGVFAASTVVALLLLLGGVPTLAQSAPALLRMVVAASPTGLASTAFADFGSWSEFFPLATALVVLLLYAAATLLITAYVIPWRVETREKSLLGIASRATATPPPLPIP